MENKLRDYSGIFFDDRPPPYLGTPCLKKRYSRVKFLGKIPKLSRNFTPPLFHPFIHNLKYVISTVISSFLSEKLFLTSGCFFAFHPPVFPSWHLVHHFPWDQRNDYHYGFWCLTARWKRWRSTTILPNLLKQKIYCSSDFTFNDEIPAIVELCWPVCLRKLKLEVKWNEELFPLNRYNICSSDSSNLELWLAKWSLWTSTG